MKKGKHKAFEQEYELKYDVVSAEFGHYCCRLVWLLLQNIDQGCVGTEQHPCADRHADANPHEQVARVCSI